MAFRRLTNVRWASGVMFVVAASAALLATAVASAQYAAIRPWLGVAMDTESGGRGARVGHVVRSSPADKAGLREGDRVTRIAQNRVVRGADVARNVSGCAVGDAIEVAFERAGKEASVHVTLAAFPSPEDMMRMDLVGTFAPTWKDLKAVNGTFPVSIGVLRGNVVVLDFWATWCAPCRIVTPKLGALQARYGAQGLSVLGVTTEDPQEVALFAQRTLMRFPVGIDRHAETTRAFGVASLPTVIVIDKRGIVRDISVGYDSSEDARLERLVRSLLAEPAAPD